MDKLFEVLKYVVGDVQLSGDQPFETLVVKDGNIIITWRSESIQEKVTASCF